jgi:hypothetical protein
MHGVTRIQGLTYNSHRHPGWYLYENGSEWGSLQCPYMHGLGIAPNGDVLVANEQMLGVLVPSDKLEDWDRENTWDGPTPWRFKSFNEALNGQATDPHRPGPDGPPRTVARASRRWSFVSGRAGCPLHPARAPCKGFPV